MVDMGKAILGLGLLLVVVGVLLLFAGRTGLPFGRLPGDFAWRGRTFQVFFPFGIAIFIGAVLSILLYLFSKLKL